MNERIDMHDVIGAFVVGIIAGAILWAFLITIADRTFTDGVKRTQQEAVNHNAAQWIETTNGNVVFKWNDEK